MCYFKNYESEVFVSSNRSHRKWNYEVRNSWVSPELVWSLIPKILWAFASVSSFRFSVVLFFILSLIQLQQYGLCIFFFKFPWKGEFYWLLSLCVDLIGGMATYAHSPLGVLSKSKVLNKERWAGKAPKI